MPAALANVEAARTEETLVDTDNDLDSDLKLDGSGQHEPRSLRLKPAGPKTSSYW